MSRTDDVRRCFDNTQKISLQNNEYKSYVEQTFEHALRHDLKNGDISQSPPELYDHEIEANIVTKTRGVLAGLNELIHILKNYELKVTSYFTDGEEVNNNEIVLSMEGKISQILSLERTVLNFLQRLCGIAKKTKIFADQIGETDCFIMGTRKTIWGMWDKRAVQCGGGLTHRLGLYDAAMLKENHLKILKNRNGSRAIKNCLDNIISQKSPRFVEVEVTNIREFRKIANILTNLDNSIPKVIMFDHFSPIKIKGAISEAKEKGYYQKIFFEASGNITLDNVKDYAKSGVDVISSGSLTHSVKSLDLSMLF